MVHSFSYQLQEILIHIKVSIAEKIKTQGSESKHYQARVLKVTDENLMFNLSGGRYLTEISERELIDNSGYTYSYEAITLEQLAEIADNFE